MGSAGRLRVAVGALILTLGARADDVCWQRKNDLMGQVRAVGREDSMASRMGLTPLIYLAFVERELETIRSIEDLANALHRVHPSFGEPEYIRARIYSGMRQHWDNVVETALDHPRGNDQRALLAFVNELRSSLPEAGYRFALSDESALIDFLEGNIRHQYQFSINRATGAPALGVTHVAEELPLANPAWPRTRFETGPIYRPWDHFIHRFYSQAGIIQHAQRKDVVVMRSFGRYLIEHVRHTHILRLSDEQMLRFLAGQDEALLATIRRAFADGGEAGLRRALAEAGGRTLNRSGRGWIVMGGLALVAGVTIAWATGPDALEKYAEHFTESYPGTDLDPAQAAALVEAFKIQDASTLGQTIYGWGCGNVGALWHAVFDNDGYPFGG